MIQEVSGDILLSKAQVVAHGVAPNDSFSSGLALALREAWPAMYKDFRHYCQTTHPKAGTIWAWAGPNGTRIVSLFTQAAAYEHGARPEVENFSNIALPRLATGVGGLDWMDVRPLIDKHLGDLSIPVIVYTTYHAGQAAAEKL